MGPLRFSCMLQADPRILHSCNRDDLRFLAGGICGICAICRKTSGIPGMCIRQQEPRNPALLQWAENARPIKAFSGQVRPGFRENRNRFCRFCRRARNRFSQYCRLVRNRFFPKKLRRENRLVFSTGSPGLRKTEIFLFRGLGFRV